MTNESTAFPCQAERTSLCFRHFFFSQWFPTYIFNNDGQSISKDCLKLATCDKKQKTVTAMKDYCQIVLAR
ncbi:unnamed protein product [Caenorhabditis brenneri]